MKACYLVTDGSKHFFYLMKFAFCDREMKALFVDTFCLGGLCCISCIKHNAFLETSEILVRDKFFGDDMVGFGAVCFGRDQTMDQVAIITQDKESGRVLIKPPCTMQERSIGMTVKQVTIWWPPVFVLIMTDISSWLVQKNNQCLFVDNMIFTNLDQIAWDKDMSAIAYFFMVDSDESLFGYFFVLASGDSVDICKKFI